MEIAIWATVLLTHFVLLSTGQLDMGNRNRLPVSKKIYPLDLSAVSFPNQMEATLWNTEELITKEGYSCGTHTVETKDGYLLHLHRIRHGKVLKRSNNKPILLMPTIFYDSTMYVNMGEKGSLAFILADQGYDVWLGNNRGSSGSDKHSSLNPNVQKKKYWNFSFHEIGIYDTTALIDYILKQTQNTQLFYGAHGQGATSYLAMLSERPKYAQKIKFAVLLAPIMVLRHSLSPIFQLTRKHMKLIETYANINPEFIPQFKDVAIATAIICSPSSRLKDLYGRFLMFLFGWTTRNFNWSNLSLIASTGLQGVSMKQIVHLLQSRSGKFRQYDYGEKENVHRYRQEEPPSYNISRVTIPTAIYYGDTDWIADKRDVASLGSQLPYLFRMKLYSAVNHFDILWGANASQTVLRDVVHDLKAHR